MESLWVHCQCLLFFLCELDLLWGEPDRDRRDFLLDGEGDLLLLGDLDRDLDLLDFLGDLDLCLVDDLLGERDPDRCDLLEGESEYSLSTESESGGVDFRLPPRRLDGERDLLRLLKLGLPDLLRDRRRFRSRSLLEDETAASSSSELSSASLENLSRSRSRARSNSLSRSRSRSFALDFCFSASLSRS